MNPSPLLRRGDDGRAVASRRSSPLIDASQLSGRYHTDPKFSSLSSRVKTSRRSYLPNVFSTPIEEDAKSSSERSDAPNFCPSPFHDFGASPNVADDFNQEEQPMKSARKNAGKHAILSVIEVSGSYVIWLLLILPALVTGFYLICNMSYKWELFSLSPTFESREGYASYLFTSPIIENYNGFVRSHFHLSISPRSSMISDPSIPLNIKVSVMSADKLSIVQDSEFYPVFALQQLLLNGTDLSMKFPLPMVSLEHTTARYSNNPWMVIYNFSASSSRFVASDVSLQMEMMTLSQNYMVMSSLVSIMLFAIATSMLVILCQRLYRHSRFAHDSVVKELPFVYQKQLSSWHFIIPEQYASVFALLLSIVNSNFFRASWMLSQVLYGTIYATSRLSFLEFMASVAVSAANFGKLNNDCIVTTFDHCIHTFRPFVCGCLLCEWIALQLKSIRGKASASIGARRCLCWQSCRSSRSSLDEHSTGRIHGQTHS